MAKKQTHSTKGLRPPKKHFTKTHAKVYWPYLPLIALLFGAAFLNIWQPLQKNQPATLAYATEMSRSSLLAGTNSERNSNGQASLTINSQLNSSAQAKANDMVARNYWSHNDPEGREPWIFFDSAGYVYTKAGENLAYGYATSNDAVIGWMNSPSHRANMLDGAFTEVGFGFANSAAYIPNTLKAGEGPFSSVGNQTIVVAHYGKSPSPAPVSTPAPTPPPQTINANTVKPAPVETPTPVTAEEIPEDIVVKEEIVEPSNQPVNTDNQEIGAAESQRTSRIQQLTGGNAPWSAVAVSIAAFTLAMIWLIKHFVIVKRYVVEGEHFVAHHPILDLIVVTIIAIAVYLNQSSGVIL